MNGLIVINQAEISEKLFSRVLSTKNNILSDIQKRIVSSLDEAKIIDLCSVETPARYVSWLGKLNKNIIVELTDMISCDDWHDVIIVIGSYYDLPKFTNCATILNYRLTIREEE